MGLQIKRICDECGKEFDVRTEPKNSITDNNDYQLLENGIIIGQEFVMIQRKYVCPGCFNDFVRNHRDEMSA
jgi:hypothetical protein